MFISWTHYEHGIVCGSDEIAKSDLLIYDDPIEKKTNLISNICDSESRNLTIRAHWVALYLSFWDVCQQWNMIMWVHFRFESETKHKHFLRPPHTESFSFSKCRNLLSASYVVSDFSKASKSVFLGMLLEKSFIIHCLRVGKGNILTDVYQ